MAKLNFQLVTHVEKFDGERYSFKQSFKTLDSAIRRFNDFNCKTTKHLRSTVIDKRTKQPVWECSKGF